MFFDTSTNGKKIREGDKKETDGFMKAKDRSSQKVCNFEGPLGSEGNHTTLAGCKIFPDLVSSLSMQVRMITAFIQDLDFPRSTEGRWKREIDVVMRIESLLLNPSRVGQE